MKTELWVIGKTSHDYLKEGIKIYTKRIDRYIPFNMVVIPDVKNASKLAVKELKIKEGEVILKKLNKGDFLIILDDKGKIRSSVQFATYMEKQLNQSYKRLIFLIGGAYGFSDAVYQKADTKFSLSAMTFSHQMVRLIFVEQLYRAISILNNEPYHHV